ncbi:hypothetical protein E3P94_00313 [Wallemia ichthyophaga]|nr:hypothetical protein E3P95_00313 [Wallemia ichthyophaga]TIB05497.1 hypothetical protein E3P94_00313 [Wallemia ichthyophaga]
MAERREGGDQQRQVNRTPKSANTNQVNLPSMSSHPTLQPFVGPSVIYHRPQPAPAPTAPQLPPIYRQNSDRPPPEFSSQQPKPTQLAQKQRKRKSANDQSPEIPVLDPQTGQPIKKRSRTTRSCDSCRARKIRCDFLPDLEPPCCRHCKQNGLPCTSNLPISETRFKKRASSVNASSQPPSSRPSPPQSVVMPPSVGLNQQPSGLHLATTSRATARNPSIATTATPSREPPPPPPSFPLRLPPIGRENMTLPPPSSEARMLGPTSISYLVHSQAQLPTSVERNLKAVDDRYHQKSSVTANGDGWIHQMQNRPGSSQDAPLAKPAAIKRESSQIQPPAELELDEETTQMLLNIYFTDIAPIFPVLTSEEFYNHPHPLLLRACCVIAATGRQIPLETLNACRSALNSTLAGSTLSRSSLVTIQALLICSLNTDAHSTALGSSGSSIWLRSGAAIRMAHDLGLHKESKECSQRESNRRRRVWAAVVIMDRWASCAHGLPMSINLVDCDVLLPSPFDFYRDDSDTESKPIINEEHNRPHSFFVEMVKNSVLLGRILQTLYSAVGLRLVTDEQLFSLAADIEQWKGDLPISLKFTGVSSSPQSGILHMAYVTLCLLLFRPMMRASENDMSEGLKQTLDEQRWMKVYEASTECIEWVYQNQSIMDHWFIAVYCLCSCALIQHYTWAREKCEGALDGLRKVVEILEQWQKGGGGDEAITWRNKLTDIIHILNKSALRPRSGGQDVTHTDGEATHMRRNPLQLRQSEDKMSESSVGAGYQPHANLYPGAMDSQHSTYSGNSGNGGTSYAALSTNKEDAEVVQSPFQTGSSTQYNSHHPVYSSVIDDSTPHHAFFDLNAWDCLMQNFQPIGSAGGRRHGGAAGGPPPNTLPGTSYDPM